LAFSIFFLSINDRLPFFVGYVFSFAASDPPFPISKHILLPSSFNIRPLSFIHPCRRRCAFLCFPQRFDAFLLFGLSLDIFFHFFPLQTQPLFLFRFGSSPLPPLSGYKWASPPLPWCRALHLFFLGDNVSFSHLKYDFFLLFETFLSLLLFLARGSNPLLCGDLIWAWWFSGVPVPRPAFPFGGPFSFFLQSPLFFPGYSSLLSLGIFSYYAPGRLPPSPNGVFPTRTVWNSSYLLPPLLLPL